MIGRPGVRMDHAWLWTLRAKAHDSEDARPHPVQCWILRNEDSPWGMDKCNFRVHQRVSEVGWNESVERAPCWRWAEDLPFPAGRIVA